MNLHPHQYAFQALLGQQSFPGGPPPPPGFAGAQQGFQYVQPPAGGYPYPPPGSYAWPPAQQGGFHGGASSGGGPNERRHSRRGQGRADRGRGKSRAHASQPARGFAVAAGRGADGGAQQTPLNVSQGPSAPAGACEDSSSKADAGKYAGSGFKDIEVEGRRFCVLLGTNPDEVRQWREERRKRWPTAANVSKKQQESRDKSDAGALEQWTGNRPARGRGGARGGARGNGRGGSSISGRASAAPRNPPGFSAGLTSPRKRPRVEVEEPEEGEVAAPKQPEVGTKDGKGGGDPSSGAATTTALAALMSAYGDDEADEKEDELDTNELPTDMKEIARAAKRTELHEEMAAAESTTTHAAEEEEPHTQEERSSYRRRRCVYFGRGNCSNGDNCTFSHAFEPQLCRFWGQNGGRCRLGNRCANIHDRTAAALAKGAAAGLGQQQQPAAAKKNPRGSQVKQAGRGGAAGAGTGAPKTLLRTLLAKELRRESSVVLQCVRYIVASGFLGQEQQEQQQDKQQQQQEQQQQEQLDGEGEVLVACDSIAAT